MRNRWWRPVVFSVFGCVVIMTHLPAQDRTLSIADAVNNALKQSQLTLPGSAPFHLKASINNPAHPSADYKAEIEEYWLSPQSWRRSINSPSFSQTLIVDGEKISETDRGDYYPFWLSDLATAIFDPLPMHHQLQSFKGAVTLSGEAEEDYSCLNFSVPAGVPPVHGILPYAFCFRGKNGLLQDVVTPGYKAHFEDYKPFKNKMVARRITAQMAPDTTLEVTINSLDEATPADRSLFTVDQPTPPAAQLRSQQVGEAMARNIVVGTPAIVWPPVREGKRSGMLSVFISVDKLGQVREVWPVASDNPELNEAAREQVMHWRFQPYVNGIPMQMESVLTFAFDAIQGAPIPLLSNTEARKLATHVGEPRTPKGTAFTLRIRVDEHGRLVRVLNPNKAPAELYNAGEKALQQWKFRPYVHGGKPDVFDADIEFKRR